MLQSIGNAIHPWLMTTLCLNWIMLKKTAFIVHTMTLSAQQLTKLLFFFLMKKQLFGGTQDYKLDNSSNRHFDCSKMQWFESMCESSHYRGKE